MGIHHLRSDASSIGVDYRGLPPLPITSWLVALLLMMFTGVVTALAWQGLAPKLSDDWYWRFDWWWRIVLYMMIFVGPVALITAFVMRWTPLDVDYVKSVHWDSSQNSLNIKRSRLCGLLSRESEFPLSDVRRIEAYVGEECGGPIAFELTIYFHKHTYVDLALQTKHIDQRDEVLDLLFSVARHCKLTHYSITENSADSMVVCADVTGTKMIPVQQQLARYDLDQISSAHTAPSPTVGQFDPQAYAEYDIRLDQWKPGQRVRFHRAAPSRGVVLFVGGILGLVAGIVASVVLSDLESSLRYWIPLGTACASAVIGMVIFRLRNLEYEVLIDLANRRIDWRTGQRSQSLTTSQIQRVLLRGFERTVKPKNGSSYQLYRCGLFLALQDNVQIRLTETVGWDPDEKTPRLALEPLAAAVGNLVNVPWSWRGHQDPPLTKFIGDLMGLLLGVGLVGLMGFFAWGVWMQGRYQAEKDALAMQLQSLGADVTQAGVDLGSIPIFGGGFVVKFSDPEFTDNDLEKVLHLIFASPNPPLLALDLSGTGITDRGVAQLVGRPGLLVLNLRNTNLTSEAVASLAAANLTALDVRGTPIHLEHLTPYRGVYPLRVLYLDDDSITDEDLWLLDAIPYLDAVLINDADSTRQAFERLGEFPNISFSGLDVAGEMSYRLD
ncbi:MAG: hypothetical protein R3C53_09680 [Pirellulaceae bacterium]